MTTISISEVLSRFVVELSYKDLPKQIPATMKNFILDTIGCIIVWWYRAFE